MISLQAPLTFGDTGKEVQNLQRALLLLAQHDYIPGLQDEYGALNEESLRHFFGTSTLAFLRRFCEETNMSAPARAPELNELLAAHINKYLTRIADKTSLNNKISLELTKNISLKDLDPAALLLLRDGQSCDIELPEWLFDMDYPGQYMRRIKSVSISLPCVTGPYTTISCKLSLLNSRYRHDAYTGGESGQSYPEIHNEEYDDPRFTIQSGYRQSIATSSARNDAGMFEFAFRDERDLPFEGAGAVSRWKIELPAAYTQFDYRTISDVILHVKYTALDGGLEVGAREYVASVIEGAIEGEDLSRLFSLKHEFPNEWHAYTSGFAMDSTQSMALKLDQSLYPFFAQDKTVNIKNWSFYLKPKGELPDDLEIELLDEDGNRVNPIIGSGIAPLSGAEPWGYTSFNLSFPVTGETVWLRFKRAGELTFIDPNTLVDDLYLITGYNVGATSLDNYPPAIVHYNLSTELRNKMLAWWKGDSTSNILQGDRLQTWHDESGHGNNISAYNSDTRPSIVSDWKAGRSALHFNGGHALRMPMLNVPPNTSDFTIFMVGEKTTSDLGILFELSDNYNGTPGLGYVLNESGLDAAFLRLEGHNIHGIPATLTTGIKGLYVIGYNTSDLDPETSVEFNNTHYQVAFGGHINDNTSDFSSDSFNIGARGVYNYSAHFKMAELILLPSKATAGERQMIKSYLKAKYGF